MGAEKKNNPGLKCPDLQIGREITCSFSEGQAEPFSIYRMVNFCLNGKYKDCPLRPEGQAPL